MFGARTRRTHNPQTCERCPNRFSEIGCPCWINVTETDEGTGAIRSRSGCFYQIVAEWMTHLTKGMNRTAAGMHSARNALVMKHAEMAGAVLSLAEHVGVPNGGTLMPEKVSEAKMLPDGSEE